MRLAVDDAGVATSWVRAVAGGLRNARGGATTSGQRRLGLVRGGLRRLDWSFGDGNGHGDGCRVAVLSDGVGLGFVASWRWGNDSHSDGGSSRAVVNRSDGGGGDGHGDGGSSRAVASRSDDRRLRLGGLNWRLRSRRRVDDLGGIIGRRVVRSGEVGAIYDCRSVVADRSGARHESVGRGGDSLGLSDGTFSRVDWG
jgi:hypothetical protein